MKIENKKEIFDFIVIDSGLNTKHTKILPAKYKGIHLMYDKQQRKIIEDSDIEDKIGHGTAVFYTIWKENKDARILVIKLFDTDMEISEKLLIDSLKYISNKYQGKIINLSCGLSVCENEDELAKVCNLLEKQGSTIVAAFANDGSISYPATCSSVIGVDISLKCQHIYDYEYVESDVINVRACGITHRLPWLKQEMKRVSGTSFACPYISALIYRMIKQKNVKTSICQIKKLLKRFAKKVYGYEKIDKLPQLFDIKNAILFPFNKEMHSIVKFSHLLQFNLKDVYDSKYLGVCGKNASTILNTKDLSKDYQIKDIDTLNWKDEFDTIILGHLEQLEQIIGKKYKKELLMLSKKNNKKVVMFDDLNYKESIEHLDNVYVPRISNRNLPCNRFGKLYKIGVPILCVTGTSSKQGKFTTQLKLREKFQKMGYKVGQLGTEPSSQLFGIDEVYPMGYGSTAYLDGMDEIVMINYLLNKIQKKRPDIILVGSQSQTIPYDSGNLRYMPIHQNNLLYASDPDGFLLICNYFDDDEYLQRNICFLNHFNAADNIIAIGIYPFQEDLQWAYLSNVKKEVEFKEAKKRAEEIQKKFGIATYILGREDKEIFEKCISYYTE